MAQQVNPPRGMRDFLARDKARREQALSKIREVYRNHGFDEIETPVVEDWSRLHAGLGGDNEKLSFSLLKRGISQQNIVEAAEADNAELLADLGLRFDLTVPLTRFYATHRSELPPVFRALQIAPVWRAERPQKGRYRQFVQADIDILGEPGLLAETELISATSSALEALGLHGCTIRVNDRRVLQGMLAYCGFDEAVFDRALVIVDKLDKIGLSGVGDELRAIDPESSEKLLHVFADTEASLSQGIALNSAAMNAALPGVTENEQAKAGLASLATLGEALADALPQNVTVSFDPTLVRGMGYYTGTIFEIAHPATGSSIGGGGRYDNMVGRFLGQDVPAVGFSLGFERIIDLIELEDDAAANSIALLFDSETEIDQLIAIKTELIATGHRVRLERKQKNMKALLDRIAAEGFQRFANVTPEHQHASQLEIRTLHVSPN